MPKKLDRCVSKVSKTVKPRKKGQTKKSAAYAICVKAQAQVKDLENKKTQAQKKAKK